MKNKKLLGLLIGLGCIALCFVILLTMCAEPNTPQPTEPEQTEGTTTEPDVQDTTELPTEENTQPPTEETTEEPTEAPTEAPTEPDKQGNVNTGTGGDYQPDIQEPTEPEITEPPVIEVDAPGAENNPYYEQFSQPDSSFTTVQLAAGESAYYAIKTASAFLEFDDPALSVTYNGTVYTAQNGAVQIVLPANAATPVRLQMTNGGSETKGFSIRLLDALGSETNPVVLEKMEDFAAALAADDANGIYYRYTAQQDGVLVVSAEDTVEVVVTVANDTKKLSEQTSGVIKMPVKQGQNVLLQVQAKTDGEGNYPAVEANVKAYLAPYADVQVETIPSEVQSANVPAGQSVFFRITGAAGNMLHIENANVKAWCNGTQYLPDANGVLSLRLPKDAETTEVELLNTAAEDTGYSMQFAYPLGHKLNPHKLTQLGELPTAIEQGSEGYYYTYTAAFAGVVRFSVWEYPATEDVKTDIVLTNQRTGESVSMWNGEEQAFDVSVVVQAEDVLTICVTVKADGDLCVEESVTAYGDLYGSEENPIEVFYPGFTAYVPAGKTLYYQGYNMSDLIFTLTGENVAVSHNGQVYSANGGSVQFAVAAAGRMPAVFAVENKGESDAQFEVVFTYPLGHMENPDTLQLGVNTATCKADQYDYCFNYTAPKAGKVIFTFDVSQNWYYVVDNQTQMLYGDTRYSNDDPPVTETVVSVNKGDVIQIRVNTFDPENTWAKPAGSISFTAAFVAGPTAISNLNMPTYATMEANTAEIFQGNFYGYSLTISSAANAKVQYAGTTYTADGTGTIRVEFPASGEGQLEYTLHHTGADKATYSMQFSTKDTGSATNPEMLTVGSHSMIQDTVGGGDYYYKFVATSTGTLTFTFEKDVDCIFIVNGNIIRYTHLGQTTYSIRVRPGAVINLAVNTYDSKQPMVSPKGTVDFTVTLK